MKECIDGPGCNGEPLNAAMQKAAKNYGNPYAPERSDEVQTLMQMLEQVHPESHERLEHFIIEPGDTPVEVHETVDSIRMLCSKCAHCPLYQSK